MLGMVSSGSAGPPPNPAVDPPASSPANPPADAPASSRALERRAYPILLALAVIDSAAYSVIGPVLPALRQVTHSTVTTMSLLAAVFPLAMVGGLILAGRLVNHGRTRLSIVIGLTGLTAGSFGFLLSTSLGWLFLMRALMGVCSGCLWLGLTFSVIEYWPGQEYRTLSRIYAAYSVGAMAGPLLGALHGVRAPFFAYALAAVVAIPLGLALPKPQAPPVLGRDRQVLRTPGFQLSAVGILFAMMAFGVVDGVLPLHFATHLSQAQIGVAFSATALLIAFASAAAGDRRATAALAVGVVGVVAGITLAGAGTMVWVWVVALILVAIGSGASTTGATGILLDSVPTERIVTAVVVWSQIGIIGYLIGPLVGGQIAAHAGYEWLGVLPLAIALVLCVLAVRTRRSLSRRR
jgi:MFS family permease